jgi:hypothetical protein
MGKSFIFMPEDEPGELVYGFPENAKIMELAARRLKLNHIPVGNGVAAAFPWMRCVAWDVDDGAGPSVVRRDPWDYTFANRYSFPIPIHEVRVYAGRNATAVQPAGWDTNLQMKLSIPNRRQIVERWMPWQALNTEPDMFVDGYLNQWAWKLPAPYFLSRSSTFQFDVRYNAALVDPEGSEDIEMFYISLHGWGVEDGEPIDLVQPVMSWAAAPATTQAFQPITFDDGRDQPMRDAFITHIGFGGGYLGNVGNNANVLEQIYVRPQPPEGPKWHHDEFYPIALLAEQLGTYGANGNPMVAMVHRPVKPYVLNPNESLVIEFVHQDYDDGDYDYDLDVGVFGTQPGTLDLSEAYTPVEQEPPDDETLIRAVVRPCPEIKYIAEHPCKLWCWVNPVNSDGSENSPVSIRRLPPGKELDDRDWAGRELPYNERIPIRLWRGDRLIAITKSEALMSMSVEPME